MKPTVSSSLKVKSPSKPEKPEKPEPPANATPRAPVDAAAVTARVKQLAKTARAEANGSPAEYRLWDLQEEAAAARAAEASQECDDLQARQAALEISISLLEAEAAEEDSAEERDAKEEELEFKRASLAACQLELLDAEASYSCLLYTSPSPRDS